MKIKIIYFLNTTVRAGAEEHLLNLIGALDRGKFEPLVVLPAKLAFLMKEDLQRLDVRWKEIYIRRWRDVGEICRFVKLLKREQPDIVNPHQFFASRFAAPIVKLMYGKFNRQKVLKDAEGIPFAKTENRKPKTDVIETAHLRESWRKGIKAFYGIDRFFGRYVDGYIAVSSAVKDYLVDTKGISEEKVRVIRNGIDVERFNPDAVDGRVLRGKFGLSDEKVVGVIGRLEPQKGHRFLIEATGDVIREVPGVKFLIVGEGSLKEKLKARTKKLGISDSFIWTGFQGDIPRVLSSVDMVILPSLWEGLPLIALEGSAMRKPVIATDVDGTPEAVKDGRTGLIVPPADSSALAKALVRLLKDERLAKEFGEEGRRFVCENFSIKRQVEETEKFYLFTTEAQKKRK